MQPSSPRPRNRARPEDVAPEDLQRLRAIHDLLATLNDPLASQPRIEKLCAAMPVLAARLVAHGRTVRPAKQVSGLGDALKFIGNRGVETVLLQLLEDLTVLKADLEDERAAAVAAQSGNTDEPGSRKGCL